MHIVEANSRQIGGVHYHRQRIQHWDFAIKAQGNRYLDACVTKYLSRWRTKHETFEKQFEDLEKSLHYLDKLIESAFIGTEQLFIYQGTVAELNSYTIEFCEGCELSSEETAIMLGLVGWLSVQRLQMVRAQLVTFIAGVRDGYNANEKSAEEPYKFAPE